jgi:hypothetical protein
LTWGDRGGSRWYGYADCVARIRDAARPTCTIARPSRNHPKIQTRATTNPQHLWLGGNHCILRTLPLSSSSGPCCCSAHVCLNTSSRNSTRDGLSQPEAIFRMTCDRRSDKAGSGPRKQKATVAGLMSHNSWPRGLHNNPVHILFLGEYLENPRVQCGQREAKWTLRSNLDF